MKRISILLLILFSTLSLFAKTKIIFDTDIDTDCDDAGALAILHALADNGEAEILATVVSTRYPYSAPCVEAINRYYGSPDIPIGVPKTTWSKTGSRGSKYARQISEEFKTVLKSNDDAPDAVTVYRRILAAQESNSVVILTVGYLTNLRDLLESKPDDISPLSGVELVRQKVSRWVCTGGTYPSDYNTAVCGNYPPDPTSAAIAVRDWPGPIWFSGEGGDIGTGGLLHKTPANNPVRRVYELYLEGKKTRPSWDPIATLFAVHSNDVFWTFREGGYYQILAGGAYEWRKKPDKEHYVVELRKGVEKKIRKILDQLMIQPPSFTGQEIEKLSVAANNRVLVKENGEPFFPIADTAWKIAWKLNRAEVEKYLQTRKDQKFNTIGIVAFPMDIDNDRAITNVYGDKPLEYKNDKFNPLKPVTTSGENYKNSKEYDYWDHLEYIIDTAESKDMYIILLPAWGGRVAGAYGSGKPNSEIIFDKTKAYKYALWISKKFKDKKNIIWMIGGDRSAVYGKNDYRSVFRAMAKGITDGYNKSPVLISYHPQKWAPNSSTWFHNDKWLSFNSIQDQPSDQINSIRHDYNLSPAKPTWLFEGGYEERGKSAAVNEVQAKRENIYNDWQVRFQAYQTIFAGGFGYTYGHMSIWDFSPEWKSKLNSPGANDMCHLYSLMTSMTDEQYFNLVPDQSLIEGNAGSMSGNEGMFSTCTVGIRSTARDFAMIYTANGRNIRVNMNKFIVASTNVHLRARWFNPRNGEWTLINNNVLTKNKKQVKEFNPPGGPSNGNDWVLVLDLVDANMAIKTIRKNK